MTPTQIIALLDRVREATERIETALDEGPEIDTTLEELRKYSAQAIEMAERIRRLAERVRARVDRQQEIAESAEGLADELENVGQQLGAYEEG